MTMTETRAKPAKAKAAPVPKAFSLDCDRDELVAALNLVGTATIERNATLAILGHVLCRLEGDMLDLVGTDLDVRTHHTMKVRGFNRANRAFTLPFRGLTKALSQFPRGELTIYVDPVVPKAVIESGSMSLTYDTLPPDDFPEPKQMTLPTRYIVTADELLRVLETVEHAISEDGSRYYLQGGYFECRENGVLRIVTCDGHRLVIDQLKADGIIKEAARIIVHGNTLRVVKRHCKAIAGGVVEVRHGAEGISLSFDYGRGGFVHSKRIDATFPDYDRVIPEDNDKLALFDSDTLYEALKRFPSPRGGRAAAEGRGVKLSLKKNVVTLSRPAIDGNPAIVQPVRCEYDGPSLEIGFNAAYLRDALSALGDQVGVAFGDAGKPILMMSAEYPQIVLMPISVT